MNKRGNRSGALRYTPHRMEANRAIAVFVVIALLFAGPLSPLLAMANGECCCTGPERAVEIVGDSCCTPESESAGRGIETEVSHGSDDEAPCSEGCDCPMPCCTAGKTMPLNRAASGLELPDHRPDALLAHDPENHAIEPHFSLLRPPRA